MGFLVEDAKEQYLCVGVCVCVRVRERENIANIKMKTTSNQISKT